MVRKSQEALSEATGTVLSDPMKEQWRLGSIVLRLSLATLQRYTREALFSYMLLDRVSFLLPRLDQAYAKSKIIVVIITQ